MSECNRNTCKLSGDTIPAPASPAVPPKLGAEDYKIGLNERLRDPQYAVDYLNAAKGESQEVLLQALRDVAEAYAQHVAVGETRDWQNAAEMTSWQEGYERDQREIATLKDQLAKAEAEALKLREALREAVGLLDDYIESEKTLNDCETEECQACAEAKALISKVDAERLLAGERVKLDAKND